MAPPKVPPPNYVELKADNFSVDGVDKAQKDPIKKAMFDAAKKIFDKNPKLVTLKPPANRVGYSFQGTVTVEPKAGGATATAKLLVNNWPKNSLYIMGSGSGNAQGGDAGIISDLAVGIMESFLVKKLIPKFQADYDAAEEELNKPGGK